MATQLWHNEQVAIGVSSAWTGWSELSNAGDLAKAVSAYAHPDGRMHSFIIDANDEPWHNEQTSCGVSAPWTGWKALPAPGGVCFVFVQAVHLDGRMHAVMTDYKQQIWQNEQVTSNPSSLWTGWNVLPVKAGLIAPVRPALAQ